MQYIFKESKIKEFKDIENNYLKELLNEYYVWESNPEKYTLLSISHNDERYMSKKRKLAIRLNWFINNIKVFFRLRLNNI